MEIEHDYIQTTQIPYMSGSQLILDALLAPVKAVVRVRCGDRLGRPDGREAPVTGRLESVTSMPYHMSSTRRYQYPMHSSHCHKCLSQTCILCTLEHCNDRRHRLLLLDAITVNLKPETSGEGGVTDFVRYGK